MRSIQPGGTWMPGSPRWEHHPAAKIFPMIVKQDERDILRASLAKHQNRPVVLHRGFLLDGRNRERELFELGLPINFVVFVGSDAEAVDFIWDENAARRQMTRSQLAFALTEYNRFKRGGARQRNEPFEFKGQTLPLEDAVDESVDDRPANLAELGKQGGVSERLLKSANAVHEHGVEEVKDAVRDGSIALHVAEKIARLPEPEQAKEVAKIAPNGARAIMASRQEPDDSLDYFPTPPWATRALIERVFPHLGVQLRGPVVEPACGEGHMAEVLREYQSGIDCGCVAFDVFDYGYGNFTKDFLLFNPQKAHPAWIITNPPFEDMSEKFVLHALELAQVGIAMFFRLQWLETVGRYERIFRDRPPTLIAFFAERVNLCKGCWNPAGGTATAYVWLVWLKNKKPQPPFWIPPGCKEALTHPDDAERFTAHPVIRRDASPPSGDRDGAPDGLSSREAENSQAEPQRKAAE